jgi:hypothetical protein
MTVPSMWSQESRPTAASDGELRATIAISSRSERGKAGLLVALWMPR